MSDVIHTSGKRKSAVAKATLREGDGNLIINNTVIDLYEPKLYRMRIKEPLLLANEVSDDVNISVKTKGGGMAGQADAARLAIARALVEYKPSLEDDFEEYDRQLLVADIRRKETSKPNRQGKARAKRQKSYR